MTSEDIERTSHFVDGPRQENIIKVIGVGGGGNNAISHMYEQGINHVSFMIINTDRQALNNSPVPNRLLIGDDGLGAGNNPEVARIAAENSAEDIAKLFDDETKMVFITAGMGGGTGTGAAPVVARIAHEKGMLTIGIVTIPFLFEGQKKILKALDGAEEMSKYVDAILVVNNEQLTEIYPDLNWMNAFGKADDTLTDAARSISELITSDGYMNLDFKDVNTTLKDGGAAIISTGYGEGEHRVTKAINDALNSPLLKNRDIFGSKRLLFNLYYSRNAEPEFAMGEAQELTSFINNLDPDVEVIYGICFDDSLGNKIKITILAAGFELVIKGSQRPDAAKRKIGGETAQKPAEHQPFFSSRKPAEQPAQPTKANDDSNIIKEIYGQDKVEKIEVDREASRYIILTPEQLEDDDAIEAIESSPAYNRDKRIIEEFRRDRHAAPPFGANRPYTPASAYPAGSNPAEAHTAQGAPVQAAQPGQSGYGQGQAGYGQAAQPGTNVPDPSATPAPDPSQSKMINFLD
jgi:cell division protein FtsZ